MKNYEGTEKEAYIEGRLLGLSELIKVLKESINTEGSNHEVIQSIVEHVSNEMNNILEDMDGVPREHIEKHAELKTKVEELKKVEKPKEETKEETKKEISKTALFRDNVNAADKLMKDLVKQ
ncbi:MAG: hypothetical protein ABH803_03570 [Candidatus Micrarchaeota archaeon]